MPLGAENGARGMDDTRMSDETARCTVCRQPLGEDGRCQHCDDDVHVWTIQDWRPLLTLGLVIVLGFSFTSLVVNTYSDKEKALATRYYQTGLHAMDAKRSPEAVADFEAALVYSHYNFQDGLELTDALVASGATSEALAQLHAFRDQRPGDAQVNLKLARLEAQRQQVDNAIRHYQDAVEGAWPEETDPVPQRIASRFESADYLVRQGRHEQATTALIALAAVLPTASPEQQRLGELFLSNGNAMEALKIFEAELQQYRNDRQRVIAQPGRSNENRLALKVSASEIETGKDRFRAALLGAARASLALGSHAAALHYLEEFKPDTAESRALREQLERMEALDPFARNANTARIRTERTMAAFHIAMDRLSQCGVPFAQSPASSSQSTPPKDPEQWSGFAKWASQLSPMMNERKLQGRDDVIESTMRFAFQSEMAAQNNCGKLSPNDEALLLLARERMGASR